MDSSSKDSALQGKRVIVVGGSSGLGLATAKLAAAEGAALVLISSNQERIDKALQELPSGSHEGHAVDMSQESSIKAFFEHVGAFDHLIYTAGENLSLINLEDIDVSEAKDFFTIRYWGALAAAKYGVPHMNKGGSIGLISGTASQRPGSGWALASSICGAMEGLCRALAVELSPIRVNIVSPGVIKTNLWSSMSEEDRENLYKTTSEANLAKRVGEAEDVAKTFLFLMQQPYATGQNFTIDGGSVLV
ncbi:NAD(P)-dependent dehydrogenase, short-chain alcohol dehydrogenase family [Catalinimonas alkaloidigena]|uniref:NAD(P)-dependent dehydrogenase, short-chain alcohol dehydrogenase family n=1 Tax=Catalinimonas alkaloidigena TaxID=1075417 RepID=A0A1G9TXV2_9BACT|nr:SDR family oxidoreductase [Catalinimonas alkaloidigena]SDM52448.1 NAD(P)-dependent dehydrogenase, short-chain alcohol dehydrogenase family [Catalinimonas alkaloidigena]